MPPLTAFGGVDDRELIHSCHSLFSQKVPISIICSDEKQIIIKGVSLSYGTTNSLICKIHYSTNIWNDELIIENYEHNIKLTKEGVYINIFLHGENKVVFWVEKDFKGYYIVIEQLNKEGVKEVYFKELFTNIIEIQ